MLTLRDCLDLCDFDEEEILAIAHHEHIPEIVAVELADFLIHSEDGLIRIRRCIVDEIADANDRGDSHRAERLRSALDRCLALHTANRAPVRAATAP